MEKIKIGIRNQVSNIKKWIRENRKEAIVLGIILLIGAFFRLYRIGEYMTFLGDEGRDVIIVRRLLVNFDPILIGPGTSIGDMYLGPLYYYMMAPALLLAMFSPVGPAVQIALLAVVTIFLVWWVGREWFGKIAGLIAAGLYAVAPTVIIYSRSSWNPNIMPFFALLIIYAIWRFWQHNEWKWLIVVSISFAFVLQSHYLGLLLAPVVGLFWFFSMRKVWKNKKLKLVAFRSSLISAAIFSFLMSPLIIFDARHGWRNFASMKKFFTERQTTISARPWNALPKAWPNFVQINTRLIAGHNETVGLWVSVAIVALLICLVLFKWKKLSTRLHAVYFLLLAWFGFALLGLGVYKQHVYDHYYGFFFAAPFLLIGGLIENMTKGWRNRKLAIIGLVFVGLVFVNLQNNPLKYPPNRQMQRSIKVTEKIEQEAGKEKFNLAVIAERNYEGAYQYFLEKNNTPIVMIDSQRADETITEQLFVVCELPVEKCDPTHNSKAEVANFGWSKVEEQWNVAGVVLFKLIHTQ
ncbi:glycosyltransferase family 39 protein [Candidatus Woesebacteria bacterium]|nr:glycosyltransferase family 39 protein [Candidatus Woesebacteria bacterium]